MTKEEFYKPHPNQRHIRDVLNSFDDALFEGKANQKETREAKLTYAKSLNDFEKDYALAWIAFQ